MLSNRQKHKISVRFSMAHDTEFEAMKEFVANDESKDEEEFEINLYERFVNNCTPSDIYTGE